MKIQTGLKLWSVNTDCYLREARRLFAEGVYDYIELYVVPGTRETLREWQALKDIPYIIHCPHFAHGFNLALPEKESFNRTIFEDVQKFADALCAPHIIIHGGMNGTAEETARQLAALDEPRAILENKPQHVITEKGTSLFCRGAAPEEVAFICCATGCGFCLDFSHAVCSANSHGVPWEDYVRQFMQLQPTVFHLSGIRDVTSELDSHGHIAADDEAVRRLLRLIPQDSRVSVETEKNSRSNLEDFRADVTNLRRLMCS